MMLVGVFSIKMVHTKVFRAFIVVSGFNVVVRIFMTVLGGSSFGTIYGVIVSLLQTGFSINLLKIGLLAETEESFELQTSYIGSARDIEEPLPVYVPAPTEPPKYK
jgi:hypothetical protein